MNLNQSHSIKTKFSWEWGTAYDMFISLLVLHRPNKFGLRGSWAKGVRTRLPSEERDFLEKVYHEFLVPLPWLYNLPLPKNGAVVLQELGKLPANDRLRKLTITPEVPEPVFEILQNVGERGHWDTTDREALWKVARQREGYEPDMEMLTRHLDWWAEKTAFGEGLYSALKVYYEVFFAEEESRIAPALQDAAEQAQELAEELIFPDLIEELSQGIRFEMPPQHEHMVMIPSFWVSPLIIMSRLQDGSGLFVFGGRPANASLVPGEVVPDALFQSLKALADPTRLRILRYLVAKPLTPTSLARRLRLRAPTVIHHLNTMRLAGLVYLTFESKGEKKYAARLNRVDAMCQQLQQFLNQEDEE